MLLQRVQLAGSDLVTFDRVRLGVKCAHVVNEAAGYRGRLSVVALAVPLGTIWAGMSVGSATVATLVCVMGMRRKVAELGLPPNSTIRDYVIARKAAAMSRRDGRQNDC